MLDAGASLSTFSTDPKMETNGKELVEAVRVEASLQSVQSKVIDTCDVICGSQRVTCVVRSRPHILASLKHSALMTNIVGSELHKFILYDLTNEPPQNKMVSIRMGFPPVIKVLKHTNP